MNKLTSITNKQPINNTPNADVYNEIDALKNCIFMILQQTNKYHYLPYAILTKMVIDQ